MNPKKILLITPVVGSHFYKGKNRLDLFPVDAPVRLIPDPTNKYDPFAVKVCDGVTDEAVQLGHIPKKDVGYSQIIATLLENGIALTARVARCEPGTVNPISIVIALAD
jgi:hypothetical protein